MCPANLIGRASFRSRATLHHHGVPDVRSTDEAGGFPYDRGGFPRIARADQGFQIYGRVDNIFDNRYATYGTFFDTGGGS